MQGVQRYVIFAYLTLGLLVWATLSKILGAVAYAVNAPDQALLGSNFTVTSLISLVVAAGAAVVAFRNERLYTFSTEVVAELKKVTWPSKKETQTETIVVIITTLILSVLLFVTDTIWAKLTGIIYR